MASDSAHQKGTTFAQISWASLLQFLVPWIPSMPLVRIFYAFLGVNVRISFS